MKCFTNGRPIMNDQIIPVILKKTSELTPISFVEKQLLYDVWLKSGVTKHKFAIDHGLSKSMLYVWFNKIENDKEQSRPKKKYLKTTPNATENTWIPIVSEDPPETLENKNISIEINTPNHTIIRLIVEEEKAINLIREVCHAN